MRGAERDDEARLGHLSDREDARWQKQQEGNQIGASSQGADAAQVRAPESKSDMAINELVRRLRAPIKAAPSGTYTIGHEAPLAWQAATAIEQLAADAKRWRFVRKFAWPCMATNRLMSHALLDAFVDARMDGK